MQILKENYRKFNKKPLLWSEGLWVFMGAEGFDNAIDTVENKESETEKKTLTNPKEIKAEAERELDNALNNLKTAYKNTESHGGNEISGAENASIKLHTGLSKYIQNKLEKLDVSLENDNKTTINKLVTEGNNLLNAIKTRVEASKKVNSVEDEILVGKDAEIQKEVDIKEKTDLNKDIESKIQSHIDKALGKLGLNNKDKGKLFKLANKLVSEIKLNKKQNETISKGGDPKLSKEQIKIINKEVASNLPSIKKYDEKEGKLIHKLLTDNTKLDDLFDYNDDVLRQYVSMKYKVESKDGKLQIDGNKVEKVEDLKQYLPKSAQAKFDKLLGVKDDDKDSEKTIEGLEKALNKEGKNGIENLKNIQKLKDVLKNTDVKEGGMFDTITGLIQAFQTIMAAWKNEDYKTLNDAFEDIKNNKKPHEEIKKTREEYKESFNKDEKNVKTLLSAYMDPHSEDANIVLKDNSSEKYRSELKPIIHAHLSKELGIKITSIHELKSGQTEIRGYVNNQEVGIKLSNNADKPSEMTADIIHYENSKNEKTGKVTKKGIDTNKSNINIINLVDLKGNISGAKKNIK